MIRGMLVLAPRRTSDRGALRHGSLRTPDLRTPDLRTLALALLGALAACGGGHPPGPSPAAQRALAERESPATWEDLDPEQPGRRLRDPRSGVVFVRVPAGEFMMGSRTRPEQGPVHRVRISRPFLLAETEVTAEQWRRLVERWGGDAAVPVESPSPQHPMFANCFDAEHFCRIYGYRLPTEAEWEWACRGGQDDEGAPWLDRQALQEFAWFHPNAPGGAMPVGRRRPNGYGLHDMLGNVWEWCSDRWTLMYPATAEIAVDPQGPSIGNDRTLRGGSWFTLPEPRPATRMQESPFHRMPFFGFRPARDLP